MTNRPAPRSKFAGGKLLRCDELRAPSRYRPSRVRDLFFNVPARKKFLRSDQTELAHIGSLVTHYSLGHCDKRFELYHEGRELLNVTPVSLLRDRAFQVFGSAIVDDLLDIGLRTTELHLPPPYVPSSYSSRPHTEPAEPETAIFQFGRPGLRSERAEAESQFAVPLR